MLQKIEKILFYLFLFFIPLQIRMTISWQGSEWGSKFLYLTDILLAIVLFLGIINAKLKGLRIKKSDLFLFLFLIIAFLSIFVSGDKAVSVFRWLKLLEFVALYVYIMYRKDFLGVNKIFKIIVFSGVLQSILTIVQFYKQSSLGLKLIEAGAYTPGEPGVATFISGTEKVMRAYGSFPHPNVLAAFLLLAIFCFYAIWLKEEKKLRITSYVLRITSYFLLTFALFLTFSREVIFTFIFISFIFFIFRFFQLRTFYHTDERLAAGKKMMVLAGFFVVFSIVSAIIISPYFKTRFVEISLEEEAIDLRFFYNKMAVEMIKEKPVSGIGIGRFAEYSREFPAYIRAANKIYNSGNLTGKQIPEWLYQPAHNIYLLIASEIGILGVLIFIIFVLMKFLKSIKPIKPKELIGLIDPMPFIFLAFLIIGLSDHFSWTLQSGAIIFWLSFALMQNEKLKIEN